MEHQKQGLGFIGTGNLTTAVLEGLQQAGKLQENQLFLYDMCKEKAAALAEQYAAETAALAELTDYCSTIVLAIKPQDMKSLVEELQSYDLQGCLIISVAVGIPLKFYQEYLPQAVCARAMPNTSASSGASATILSDVSILNEAQKQSVENIFSSLGCCFWLKDEQMDLAAALASSGPAYYYYLAEALAKAGNALGLPMDMASKMAGEVLIGAGKTLRSSGQTPEALRKAVTSPKGTTLEAIAVFENKNLIAIFQEALAAATKRAFEIGREQTAETK